MLVLAALLLAVPLTASAATHHPVLVKTAHAAFGSCAAADITMRVSVPRLTFTANQPVTVRVQVRNTGTSPCNYPGSLGVGSLTPCGPISMVIRNSKGANVWPGVVPYACPMFEAQPLAPGKQVTAQGTWDQKTGSTTRTVAPRGRYRLVIAGSFTFPLVLR